MVQKFYKIIHSQPVYYKYLYDHNLQSEGGDASSLVTPRVSPSREFSAFWPCRVCPEIGPKMSLQVPVCLLYLSVFAESHRNGLNVSVLLRKTKISNSLKNGYLP